MSDLFKLSALGHGAANAAGVIKAADAGHMTAASSLIAEAEAQAQAILASAQEVYETEKARGYADGRAEADAARAVQMTEDLAQMDVHLAKMDRALGGVVFSSVKRIVEGFDDEALAVEIARSSLGAMRSERRGQLHVSTAALAATRAALPDLLAQFPEIELVDIIEDVDLTLPNVRLESALGVVGFELDSNLDALRLLLEQREG